MQRRDEFDALDELRHTGSLPSELEARHQKLRRQRLVASGRRRDRNFPTSDSRLHPELATREWLRAKWISADATVRRALRLLADALGIPLPMTRTRRTHQAGALINDKDSSPARRSESEDHPSHGESEPLASTADKPAERGYHDRPEWDDDDADGWESCSDLHDALHPDDRGWY